MVVRVAVAVVIVGTVVVITTWTATVTATATAIGTMIGTATGTATATVGTIGAAVEAVGTTAIATIETGMCGIASETASAIAIVIVTMTATVTATAATVIGTETANVSVTATRVAIAPEQSGSMTWATPETAPRTTASGNACAAAIVIGNAITPGTATAVTMKAVAPRQEVLFMLVAASLALSLVILRGYSHSRSLSRGRRVHHPAILWRGSGDAGRMTQLFRRRATLQV